MSAQERKLILDEIWRRGRTAGKKAFERQMRERARRLYPAVFLLAMHGLRVGDVAGVQIADDQMFSAKTKGGQIRMKRLHPDTLDVLRQFALTGKRSFAQLPVSTIKDAARRLTKNLFDQGRVRIAYSSHDFLHLYAADLYQASPDLIVTQRALGHASVTTTQIYLQQLGVIDLS